MRHLLVAGVLPGAIASATAQTTLRVGDQKGNSQAVMEAAGVLKDVPYRIELKEFPAAAPLLEALGAGAIETGVVGDAPFTFAAAANVAVKAIGAIRQSQEGLAIPPAVPRNWLSRAKIRLARVDDGVVADEQKTIDLYLRSGLIKKKLNAADIVDRSFAGAIGKGAGL
jgi:ABC-type nitrate/sulfonate/bicarbonate transport system substrate-binding protein